MLFLRGLSMAVLFHASTAFARTPNDIGDVSGSLYCLSHSRFGYENPKSPEFRVRYFVDQANFESERRIVLFVEADRGRIRLYDIVVLVGADRQYRLTNNASLQDWKDRYEFVDPPLGGIASHVRLKRAFDKVSGQPHQTVKAASVGKDAKSCKRFDYGS